jgi:hypothetical protein
VSQINLLVRVNLFTESTVRYYFVIHSCINIFVFAQNDITDDESIPLHKIANDG